MNTKLIIVEGLPGAGKSTVSKLIKDTLDKNDIKNQMFCEGNINHLADFEGVAFYKAEDYQNLIREYEEYRDVIHGFTEKKEDNYLVSYRKLNEEWNGKIPMELLQNMQRNDVYELPFNDYSKLILVKWDEFQNKAINANETFVIECCFIQNPVTVSMIKNNNDNDVTKNFIKKISNIIETLNPILIYVAQENVKNSFEKICNERPEEWKNGFVDYYTNQAYGKERNYFGLEGTVEVLNDRKKVEIELIMELKMEKYLLDNSKYDLEKTKKEIGRLIIKEQR